MAVSAPVDATKTAAWAALQNHYNELTQQGISLKDWFAADDKRVEKLTFDVNDLRFDLSKNLITDETVKLLVDLAREVKVMEIDLDRRRISLSMKSAAETLGVEIEVAPLPEKEQKSE